MQAESPYGMSAPSTDSAAIRIPGRAVDMEFLAVESRIINEVLLREDGDEVPLAVPPTPASVSPVPRRRKAHVSPSQGTPSKDPTGSNEFMLVLYPGSEQTADEKAGKLSTSTNLRMFLFFLPMLLQKNNKHII